MFSAHQFPLGSVKGYFLDMCSHCKGDSETAIALQSQDKSSPCFQTSG